MKKIHITINEGLLEEIDKAAQENYITRSGMISMACANFIQQRRLSEGILTAAKAMQRVSETGVLSDSDKEELEAFLKVAELYQSTL